MSSTTLTLTPNLSGAVTQALNDRNPFYVDAAGFDMPVAVYDEEYAESNETEGGRRVRSRPQNPTGTIPLRITSTSAAALRTSLDNLQQTVEACRSNGGYLTYAPNGGTTVYYDLESIRLSELPQEMIHKYRATPVLEFVCRPFGRLAPISLVSNATSSEPIQSVSLVGIPGSVSALIQATITDTATQARDHLEVGLDPNWDGSAALLIDSASLSVSGLAGSSTTRTGAYSSNGVVRTTLATSAVGCCEATGLTHRDRHRVKARIWGAGTGPIYVRAAYRIGSGPWTRNPWKKAQGIGAFYEMDLGIVKANQNAGTLTVRVEAYSTTSGDTLDVDYLEVIPVYLWAKARGATDNVATGYTLLDRFNQTAGNLDAPKAADTGGNWSEANRTGSNGFQVEATGHTAQRTTVSDATLDSGGSYALLGSSVAACSVQAAVKFDLAGSGTSTFLITARFGLLARYVDASNWFALALVPSSTSGGGNSRLAVMKKVAGSMGFGDYLQSAFFGVTGFTHLIRLEVDASGAYRAYWQGNLAFSGADADLATGGPLASGKRGLYDAYTPASANTRTYDNFQGTEPTAQHVIDASGAVVLDHESIARSDGTRPPEFEGSYLKCPPAGREDRTHRLAVKLRRNDVDVAGDSQIADGQSVDVTVTPRVSLL